MDELLAPSPSDPDSSLPSLFPYDSFPIPRGLYAELNRSTTSLARDRDERDPDTTRTTSAAAAAVSTPRGKVLVGLDLHTTLRRPSGGLTGLAPALPVSPPRTASSKSSSPATSPTRSRRVDAADLRSLAQRHRAREFDGDLPSHRASRSTLASCTSTESVYEDAIEPETDDAEEVLELPAKGESPAKVLPPLDSSHLPDTPPELEVPDREPRSRQITPRPNSRASGAADPAPFFASPTTLSPQVVASLDEQALYEQRQAELHAEVKRRPSSRLSISSLPTSPRGGGGGGSASSPSYRRHSGVLPLSPRSQSHVRRLSLSSPPVGAAAGARIWHPKPLVLTPARTMSTPLTADPSVPASPHRHLSLSTHDGSLDGGAADSCHSVRSHSRQSSLYDGTIRSVSPLSPGGHAASRSTSPCLFQPSPNRPAASGNPRRRSLGYVDSSCSSSLSSPHYYQHPHHDPLSTFGRRAMIGGGGGGGYERRGRTASEDTRVTRSTIDSASSTRFTHREDDETPESSSGGWSDEQRKPSPLLDDREWEQQWHVHGGGGGGGGGGGSSGGTPLETVAEVSLANVIVEEEDDHDADAPAMTTTAPAAPIVRRRAATEDRESTGSGSSQRSDSVADCSFATTVRPGSTIRRDSVPPTPPPKMPLPRPPPSTRKRGNELHDESVARGQSRHRRSTGSSSSSSSVGDDDDEDDGRHVAAVEEGERKPNQTLLLSSSEESKRRDILSSSPRRPIVIKGTTSRSAAALARRTARLSLIDPPRHYSSASIDSIDSSSELTLGSRPSSRASRRTVGQTSNGGGRSREGSHETRFGGGGGGLPLSTLPESESVMVEDDDDEDAWSSNDRARSTRGVATSNSGTDPRRFESSRRSVSSRQTTSRASHYSSASPRISIGSTFANGFGATRRVELEPRDPRTREELDAGQGSYLEVLLYSDPPPRPTTASARSSTAFATTTTQRPPPPHHHKKSSSSIGTPLIRSDSPPTATGRSSSSRAAKPGGGNNLAQKLFGGFRSKSAASANSAKSDTTKATTANRRRPMSMVVPNSTTTTTTMAAARAPPPELNSKKPRPIVSGPLELQRAELEHRQQQQQQQQRLHDGERTTNDGLSGLSVSFAQPTIPIMKSYSSLARVYYHDQDATASSYSSQSQLNRSASLETIERPAPRPFSLPPGLVAHGSRSSESLRAPAPPRPIKPARSPLRPVALNQSSSSSSRTTSLLQPNRNGQDEEEEEEEEEDDDARRASSSPVYSSFESFQSHKSPPRSAAIVAMTKTRSSSSSSSRRSTQQHHEPIGVRDVLRGQFLEHGATENGGAVTTTPHSGGGANVVEPSTTTTTTTTSPPSASGSSSSLEPTSTTITAARASNSATTTANGSTAAAPTSTSTSGPESTTMTTGPEERGGGGGGGAAAAAARLEDEEMLAFGTVAEPDILPPPPNVYEGSGGGDAGVAASAAATAANGTNGGGTKRSMGTAGANAAGGPLARAKRPKNVKFSPAKVGKQLARRAAAPGGAAAGEVVLANNDYCDSCGGKGHFLCCEGGCLRSFHFGCLEPPLEIDDVPEESWFCKACRAKAHPPPRATPGFFADLIYNVEKENPKAFQLSTELKQFYKNVAVGLNGEFIDSNEHRPPSKITGRAVGQEDRDGYRLKDKNGRPIICYNCSQAANPHVHRRIISCDFCDQHWHLDCLNPPMTGMPPPTRKWMCPVHSEHVLPKKRVPRHGAATVVTVDERQVGVANNGDVVVLARNSAGGGAGAAGHEQPQRAHVEEYEEMTVNRIRYQVPEQNIILDFWAKVQAPRRRRGGGGRKSAGRTTTNKLGGGDLSPRKKRKRRSNNNADGGNGYESGHSSPLTDLTTSSEADNDDDDQDGYSDAAADEDDDLDDSRSAAGGAPSRSCSPTTTSMKKKKRKHLASSPLDNLALLAEVRYIDLVNGRDSETTKLLAPPTTTTGTGTAPPGVGSVGWRASSPTTTTKGVTPPPGGELTVQSKEDLKALMQVRKLLLSQGHAHDASAKTTMLSFLEGAPIIPKLAFVNTKQTSSLSSWQRPWESKKDGPRPGGGGTSTSPAPPSAGTDATTTPVATTTTTGGGSTSPAAASAGTSSSSSSSSRTLAAADPTSSHTTTTTEPVVTIKKEATTSTSSSAAGPPAPAPSQQVVSQQQQQPGGGSPHLIPTPYSTDMPFQLPAFRPPTTTTTQVRASGGGAVDSTMMMMQVDDDDDDGRRGGGGDDVKPPTSSSSSSSFKPTNQ
ncbi:hypothetical protein JCM3766R1_005335 [Sporobolomyces carnicolor]